MIDWRFISQLEGGQRLDGYVPDPSGSRSGVTIATGFDLGGRTPASLRQLLGANHSVTARLIPYAGLTGNAAVQALRANPLTITQAEADHIDRASKQQALNAVRAQYDRDVLIANTNWPPAQRLVNFDRLPGRAQTVIASVAFQYGTPWQRTPTFWGARRQAGLGSRRAGA